MITVTQIQIALAHILLPLCLPEFINQPTVKTSIRIACKLCNNTAIIVEIAVKR